MESIEKRFFNLTNYERHGSNSNNYGTSQTSASPESFPTIMENGVLIEYNAIHFSSEIGEDANKEALK